MTGGLVTEIGEPIDGVTLPACNQVSEGGQGRRTDQDRNLRAFTFADYCTNYVIAVEVTQGDPLMLFEVKK